MRCRITVPTIARFKRIFSASFAALAFFVGFAFTAMSSATAGEFWFKSDDAAVVTNNDCGSIADVTGMPKIRRQHMAESEPGLDVYIADRIHTGDVLETPAGGTVEWVCGNNLVVTVGPLSRVRLNGTRSIGSADGRILSRLDVELLAGSLRVQVRYNMRRPEAIMVAVGNADVVVERGDVMVSDDAEAMVAVVAGEAAVRPDRNDFVSTVSVLDSGAGLGARGPAMLNQAVFDSLRRAIPFSFEKVRAALPPLPAATYALEAP